LSYLVEVDRRFSVRQGLPGSGRTRLEPGASIDLTVTIGVAFDDDQLDDRGRFFDTDAAAELIDRACAGLADRPWTELFEFRPTFELVARHLFETLAIPQLDFVQLHDETFGSRTRYRPRFSRFEGHRLGRDLGRGGEVGEGAGLAEQVALAERAAQLGQRGRPGHRLDALGDHDHVELGADRQDRPAEGTGAVGVDVHIGQRRVELDDVDRQRVQLSQGVEAAAEIVQGDAYALGP
jgi:hypothetical protein